MLSISTTDRWEHTFPDATIGVLELSGIDNTRPAPGLDAQKRATEAALQARYQGYTRQDFLALPAMAAYARYYKQFNKTFHVLQQVESIALKGKRLPNVSPLVDANFTAEVDTLILTAGHDVAKLAGAITIDVSREGDQMVLMNGKPKTILPDDMVMKDDGGICCTIIYGQDNRSPISPATSHVLYVAYAPAGVPRDAVETHFKKIEANIRLFSETAVVEQCTMLCANADVG